MTRETPEEREDRLLRASVPEILVEAPISVGMLFSMAENNDDRPMLDAVSGAIASGIQAALRVLADRVGDQDFRHGYRARPPRMVVEPVFEFHRSAVSEPTYPRPHAHLTVEPWQRFRDGRGRRHVDPENLIVCAASAQTAFSMALREDLGEIGFDTTDLPTDVSPAGWELSAVADRAAALPGRAECHSITPGQRQAVPLDKLDRRRHVA